MRGVNRFGCACPRAWHGPGPKNGRGWGSAGVRREFDGEDWGPFNRISLWIYPDCPGWQVVALELRLHNEGARSSPAPFGQEGETTIVLHNQEWNHVVWEVGNLARDKVTRFEISACLAGHEPEAADTLTYHLDRLELQKVEPDYIEGWEVWPGRISFSHPGYQSGAAKSAIATGLKASCIPPGRRGERQSRAVQGRAIGQNASRGIPGDGFF